MRSTYKAIVALLLVFSFSAAIPVGAQTAPAAVVRSGPDYSKALENIETKTEARRKELGIPGMALAIVKDDKIIFMKGLGFKDFENKVAVTPDTQFAIGSATKAFTALTVLMAQDEGKLSIDESPKKYLSYFHMADPDIDREIKVRDLMCHASGLNRTDLAMITGRLSREELIRVAGDARPTAKLREKFQYQNIMFAAVGEIAATVEKTPYERLVPNRIFKPLGMKNSTMSVAQMQKAKDYSFGYNYNFDTKATERLPFREITDTAPAGSINSSARDMAEWLRFVMNGGTARGKRLVSEAGFTEWTKPQMKIAGKTSYGFGWFVQDYKGLKVLQHGGNIDGFNSMVAMIPEKKLGFVMLTNVSASPLGGDLMSLIFNNLAGVEEAVPAQPGATGTGNPPADSAVAKELIGQYSTPGGEGTIEIKEGDGKVTFNIAGQPPYALAPRGVKDTFSMSPLPDTYQLKVKRADDGKVASVVVAQPEGEFEFKRAAAAAKPPIPVDELRQKVLNAMGGEANIRKVTSRVSTVEVDLLNQGVRGTGTSWTKAGSKSATETHLTALGREIAQGWEYFDGTAGSQLWSFAPEDKYTGKRLADARRSADLYAGLDWTQFKNVTVQAIKKVGDEDAYQVRFEVKDGTDYTEYYSTKTFLLLKHEGVEVSSTSSQSIPFTVTYSDYRDVDGVVLPFKTVSNSISQGDIVSVIKSIKQNVPIEDTLFAPRKVK